MPKARALLFAMFVETAWTRLRKMEKAGDISKDEQKAYEDDVQDLTDKFIGKDRYRPEVQRRRDHASLIASNMALDNQDSLQVDKCDLR